MLNANCLISIQLNSNNPAFNRCSASFPGTTASARSGYSIQVFPLCIIVLVLIGFTEGITGLSLDDSEPRHACSIQPQKPVCYESVYPAK